MRLADIIERLNKEYPPEYAVSWDNSGLQVGDRNQDIKKIYVALDATYETIQECERRGINLLITHHPLLMGGLKNITTDSFQGKKVLTLIQNHIAEFAIHTNYDVSAMAKLAEAALKLSNTEILEVTGQDTEGVQIGIGCTGDLQEEMTMKDCCNLVKNTFHLDTVRLFGNPEQMVKRAAVCPGSGKGMVSWAKKTGAQVLITGDIGHHDGLDAVDDGLAIIDAGHYGIEHIFIHHMTQFLKQEFPQLEVCEATVVHPFHVY